MRLSDSSSTTEAKTPFQVRAEAFAPGRTRSARMAFSDHRAGTAALQRTVSGIDRSPRVADTERWARKAAHAPRLGGVAQRALKPASGKFKVTAGLEDAEKSLSGFLTANGIGHLFYPDDRVTLTGLHAIVLEAHTAHRKTKGATTGRKLETAYDDLVAKATATAVMPGNQQWTDLLEEAEKVIVMEEGASIFTKAAAAKAVAAIWPSALGDVPGKDAPFTKAVLKAAKPEAERPAPKVLPAGAKAVILHADQRYSAWRAGDEPNRGAWHGSDAHGAEPNDYSTVSSAVLAELRDGLPTGGWRLHGDSLSAEKGFSLHRGGFIYHL